MNEEKVTPKQIWRIEKILQDFANRDNISFEEVKAKTEGEYGKIEELSKSTASKFIARYMQREITETAVEDSGAREPKKIEEVTEPIKTEKGLFFFKEINGKLFCRNEANEHEYELDLAVPYCACKDFQIRKQGEWCKHLDAANQHGYDVARPPVVEKEEKMVEKKENFESVPVSLSITDSAVKIPIQVPSEVIETEDQAVKVIRDILGKSPRKNAVIEEFAGIEEISADVILSLAKKLGIEVRPVGTQCERKTSMMNLGKVFEQMPFENHKKEAYQGLAMLMPEVEVTTFTRMMAVAGWRNKKGNMRVGLGVKEEYLTPFRLADLVKRGVNFIETMCWSKAAKKAVLNSLPITKEGLLQKLKDAYGWE